MRGYLHGGLLMDFVGELGPISKLRLVFFDLVVMALQFVVLAIFLERRELKRAMDLPIPLIPSAEARHDDSGTRQDHDAEEQGLLRADREVTDPGQIGEIDSVEEMNGPPRKTEHHLDAFYSGQASIASLHLLDTIRASWGWTFETTVTT